MAPPPLGPSAQIKEVVFFAAKELCGLAALSMNLLKKIKGRPHVCRLSIWMVETGGSEDRGQSFYIPSFSPRLAWAV